MPGITVYEIDTSGLFVTDLEGFERKVPSEEVKRYLIKYFSIAAGIWGGLSLFEYFRQKRYCNKFIAKILRSQNIIIDQEKLSKSAENY